MFIKTALKFTLNESCVSFSFEEEGAENTAEMIEGGSYGPGLCVITG